MTSNCCTHTDVGYTEVWWQVDLLQQSVIETVYIIYRNERTINRLAGFEIYLSDSSDWRSGARCYKDNTVSLTLMTAIQNVACVGVGQYVTIYNDRREKAKSWYSDQAILELCEVYVYGCILGKFGNGQCNDDCLSCLDDLCHPTSGVCDNCAAGYYRSNFTCVPCPPNCAGNTCNGSSGTCAAGCKAGFSGIYCRCPLNCADQSCPSTGHCSKCDAGYHGVHCNFPCPTNCKNNMCSMNSGQCDECNVGFFGNHCDQPCPGNCENRTCNKDSGLCTDCNDGYYGPTCTPCATTCSTNTCDKTTGNCLQCEPGFYGDMCSLMCPDNCRFGKCNMQSGQCIECISGFHGNICDQPCPDNCGNNICSIQNGQCLITLPEKQAIDTSAYTGFYIGFAILGAFLGISVCFNICLIVLFLRQAKKIKSPNDPPETFGMQQSRNGSESCNYDELDVTKVDNVKNIYDSIQE